VLKILVDTCVWLDIAKDYRQQPIIHALEKLIEEGEVCIVLPRVVANEFARNKERIIADSRKSLSSVFKRVMEAVVQFGKEGEREAAIDQLHDVDHRMATLGEAVNESIGRLEKIFALNELMETSESVKCRAADRAIDKRAPFHRSKNSMVDALLIEIYADLIEADHPRDVEFAFVTHNKQDFSDMGVDERKPHPDIANLFGEKSTYSLALGQLLNEFAPEWLEDFKFDFEYHQEPRRLSEILEAEHLLLRQVWYNRHWNLRSKIDDGSHAIVPESEYSRDPYRPDQTLDSVWAGALAAAKRTEDEVGLENLGPWDDFEWGMINGKLSALRWVMGDEWDMLDT